MGQSREEYALEEFRKDWKQNGWWVLILSGVVFGFFLRGWVS